MFYKTITRAKLLNIPLITFLFTSRIIYTCNVIHKGEVSRSTGAISREILELALSTKFCQPRTRLKFRQWRVHISQAPSNKNPPILLLRISFSSRSLCTATSSKMRIHLSKNVKFKFYFARRRNDEPQPTILGFINICLSQ